MRIFLLKCLNICLIIVCLCCYQDRAIQWQSDKEKQEEQQAAAEKAWEQYYLAREGNETETSGKAQDSKYQDGVYQDSGDGFGGKIVVEITVKEDRLEGMRVVSADGETKEYLERAENLMDTVIEKQSLQVDAISGATYSSNGILDAVEAALQKAQNGGRDEK